MKILVVVGLCLVLSVAVWARPDDKDDKKDEKYDDKLLEGVDVDDALHNDRLRTNYFKCFRSGEKCTSRAKEVKELIPEALTTNCAKCTDKQKEIIKKVFRFILKNHPEEFLALEEVYDKDRIYREKYSKEFLDEGLTFPK